MISGSAYSRFVSWLKILLPLTALGLLSTIFLFSASSDPTANLPVQTREALSDRVSEEATGARYSGTTDNGTEVSMNARSTRPDPSDPERINAQTFDARLTMKDGSTIDIASPDAALTSGSENARLTGGVTIDSSTGYKMQTDSLTAELGRIAVVSDGEVTADGPAGSLRAGRMEIVEDEAAEEGDLILRFTDGVRMIYQPETD